jgi:hydroxymethylpyrimidine/phosphomethylpyrimidine kinase
MIKKVAMSIAGFDPSGGSGLQADLKTFNSIGVHGVTVVTCITVQNTKKITDIFEIPLINIEKQFDILFEDFDIDFVKTGVLYSSEIVQCISKKISEYNLKSVIDPIFYSSSGYALSDKSYIKTLKKELIPKAYMITPNILEAQLITGEKIESLDNMKIACKKLYDIGPEYVFIKGGHLKIKQSSDMFFDGKKFNVLSLPRILNKKAHGTGCTLSALITGFLTFGEKPFDSVRKSKNILWNIINQSYSPGKGSDVLNLSSDIIRQIPYYFPTKIHFKVWDDLKKSIDKILYILNIRHIPEVGINIGYALPNAKKIEDICAIKGRIVKSIDKPIICGNLTFGASKHISSIILAANTFNSDIRCAMNIKYSKAVITIAKKKNFKIGSFDREKEPLNKISTMEWGTKQTIINLNDIPDIIYDKGGKNKEPMIRILGKNPKDVVDKMYILLN